jgi:glycosyltransferase involved in cell wall biosynthesis
MSLPVIVVSYNRKTPLEMLLKRIEFYDNIIVLDNNSTYEPLLDFYSELDRPIIRLKENVGHLSPWLCGVVPSDTYYAVTDCDVVPTEECPDDFIDFLKDVCSKDHSLLKVGLSLKIDDIPDTYELKQRVIDHESQFWARERVINGITMYDSPIDTTFAVYAPNTHHSLVPSLRAGNPYVARHTPWYTDSSNLTDEELYYRNSMREEINNWNKSL